MRKTRSWTGLRMSAFALALVAFATEGARASAIDTGNPAESVQSTMDYSTTGTIGTQGVDGPGVVGFNSVASGSFTAPSFYSLGEFLVSALPEGVTTTYTNTPFTISYLAQKVDGKVPDVNSTPVTVKGVLNGKVTGGSQSSLVATFDTPKEDLKFQTGGFYNLLNIKDLSLSLVPSTTNGGRTTAQGQILVSTVPSDVNTPEPTSIAVFLTAITGLCLRRRLRAAA